MSQDSISKPSTRRDLSGLFVGATYPLRALKLFAQLPHLRRYVLLPILLNLVIGVTLYATLLITGLQAIDALLTAIPTWVANAPHPQIDWSTWTAALPNLPHFTWPSWLPHLTFPHFTLPHLAFPQVGLPKITLPSWLAELPEFGLALFIWVVRLLLVITLLLLTGFILLQFGVLLGAPWYGQLSEELERVQTGQLQIIRINPIREIWRAVLYELKKLVLLVIIGLPLFIGNFFPGVGTLVATGGGIALASTLVCLDFLDSTLERRRLQFRQKLGLIWQCLPTSAGFALTCLGLVSIPFVNLLAIPICVAAGTLFACDQVLPILAKRSNSN
jgi:CysZ protein